MLKRRLQRLIRVYTCQNAHCWKSHVAARFNVMAWFTKLSVCYSTMTIRGPQRLRWYSDILRIKGSLQWRSQNAEKSTQIKGRLLS